MRFRLNLTVGRKIYAIIALSFVGFLGVTYYDTVERSRGLQNQKQQQLQYLTELALGIVKESHAAAQAGRMTAEQAQKDAMTRIAAMRYGHDDYFWINDMRLRMVMHPMKPEMNGTDISQF